MIIFGTRTKYLPVKSGMLQTNCDHCGTAQSLDAVKRINYFHIFWIPIFPYRSQLITECGHCKKVNYQREIPPQVLTDIRNSGAVPKTPLGYFTGLILVGLFIGLIMVIGISSSIKTNEYLENPKVGDVYEIRHRESGNSIYTLYRIAQVTADSITFDVNDYEAKGRKQLRQLKKKYGNDYSEQLVLSSAELITMKKENHISNIERAD